MKTNKMISGLLTILIGILLIVMKDDMVGVALTVFGVAFIVIGVVNILQKQTGVGLVKVILGIVTLVFGWVLVSIAFYVLGIILVVYGVMQFLELLKSKKKTGAIAALLRLLPPVISVLAGLSLLFNQGGVLYWTFIIAGVFLIAEGILLIASDIKK